MIPRILEEPLKSKLESSKLILVKGPNNSGKLFLLESILKDLNKQFTIIDCFTHDDAETIEKQIGESPNVILLNEAQYISDFDLLVDRILSGLINSQVVAICSFRPELDELLIEALKNEGLAFELFPPTFYETAGNIGTEAQLKSLEDRLIFGSFPLILEDLEHAGLLLSELAKEIVTSSLGAKDRVNKTDKLLRLLQLLAFEIGEPVSYNDLGDRCDLDNETVERYIELLEKSYILIRLPAYHTELRYELKKSNCFYFFDNGIRNALIANFNPPALRNDMKELWKNYLISERIKWTRMKRGEAQYFFWRTHTRQQIDLIEYQNGQISAYKMDWEKRNKACIPKYFEECYPECNVRILNKNTFMTLLTKKVN